MTSRQLPVRVINSYLQIPKSMHNSHVMHVHLSNGQRYRQAIWCDTDGMLCNPGMEFAPRPKAPYVLVFEAPDEVMTAMRSLGPEVYKSLGIQPLRFHLGLSTQHRLPDLTHSKETKPR